MTWSGLLHELIVFVLSLGVGFSLLGVVCWVVHCIGQWLQSRRQRQILARILESEARIQQADRIAALQMFAAARNAQAHTVTYRNAPRRRR